MPRRLIDDKLEDIINLEDTVEIDSSAVEDAFQENADEQIDQATDDMPVEDEFDGMGFEDEEF